MTNAMPTFAILRNRIVIDYVSAVSYAQAMERARPIAAKHGYKRFELMACGSVRLDRKGRESRVADNQFNAGRSRYATPGFEDRRAALIAAHKAGE